MGSCGSGCSSRTEDELANVQDRFGLHDLAVEDAQSFHLRPKIERTKKATSTFAVLRTARYVEEREEVEFGEVSVFLLASLRDHRAPGRGQRSARGAAAARANGRTLLKEGPAAILWAILDTIVDDYAPVIEGLEQDVEEVERTVFSGAAAPTERIYLLRREATDFYRAVHPLLGPLDALERGVYLPRERRAVAFFRDVNDHLKLVNEEVDRPARRAGDDPPGQHGGHLQPTERDQRSPERDHEAADAGGHDLPAA